MRSAMRQLDEHMPLNVDRLPQLSEERVRALDQFIYRFGKLQDTAGTQLFPALLAALEEPYRGWAMRDRLNRLAQLDILRDLQAWQAVRAVRNRLTHEYPDDSARQVAILNEAWNFAPVLLRVVGEVVHAAEQRLGWPLPAIAYRNADSEPQEKLSQQE
jgi:hypothetical protein